MITIYSKFSLKEYRTIYIRNILNIMNGIPKIFKYSFIFALPLIILGILQGKNWNAFLSLFLLVLFFGYIFIRGFYTSYNRNKSVNATCVFLEDSIQIITNESDVKINYSLITNSFFIEKLLLLNTKNKVGIPINCKDAKPEEIDEIKKILSDNKIPITEYT